MSSDIEKLGKYLSTHLDCIKAICKSYGYEVEPTLVLRHPEGSSYSMVMTNDDMKLVVSCIQELAEMEAES